MLGLNSRKNLWVSMQAELGTLSRQSWQCRDIGASFFVIRLCCCFVTTIVDVSLQKCLSRKVVKCHDICAAPISLAFIVSLSRQCSLTLFFDDCREKLFIIATM